RAHEADEPLRRAAKIRWSWGLEPERNDETAGRGSARRRHHERRRVGVADQESACRCSGRYRKGVNTGSRISRKNGGRGRMFPTVVVAFEGLNIWECRTVLMVAGVCGFGRPF